MLMLWCLSVPVRAQLISPGKLTAAHARFEGISNCTMCHALGQRGVEPAKCLACHTPLRARIRRDEGFHATVERDCGSCHKDHFGRDFDPIRFDTDAFDHRETGYPLVGEHAGADCRSCHTPEFITAADVRTLKLPAGRLDETYLGVADDCATCHRRDNPHSRDFADNDCASCHGSADNSAPPRDTRGNTDPSLLSVGAHQAHLVGRGLARAMECSECHVVPEHVNSRGHIDDEVEDPADGVVGRGAASGRRQVGQRGGGVGPDGRGLAEGRRAERVRTHPELGERAPVPVDAEGNFTDAVPPVAGACTNRPSPT